MATSGYRFVGFLAMMMVIMVEAADREGFPVSIIHINDLHARYVRRKKPRPEVEFGIIKWKWFMTNTHGRKPWFIRPMY